MRLPLAADPEAARRGRDGLIASCAAAEAATEAEGLLEFAENLINDPEGRSLLDAVFGNSPYLTGTILGEPDALRRIILENPGPFSTALIEDIRRRATPAEDEAGLGRRLRIAKRRLALAVALADIADIWSLEDVTRTLSEFADAAIAAAADFVIRRAAGRGAFELAHPETPSLESGYFVLAMGKLGAGELNYSSDIDLICLYDTERIRTSDSDQLQSHAVRMTRTLVRLLDERTTDGYVFRTDLRLRPDPGSTPLSVSVLAAETYYESVGQNWERAAMIKARSAGGDIAAGMNFLTFLKPFVWRKNLDFAAIQDIHSIKRQIHARRGGGVVRTKGHNIKIGRGGIREVEFFAQTQQLIWGGREPRLRQRRTLDALQALVELGHVASTTAEELTLAYRFLRRVEHRLQMTADEQTQTLPDDDASFDALAKFLGYDNGAAFSVALTGHLETVQRHYAALFEDAPELSGADAGNLSFTGVEADPGTLKTLTKMGFANAKTVDGIIRGWHHGRIRATRSTRAREILTELTPALLAANARQPDPDTTFLKFDTFVSGLPAGVQLFSMFQAYPDLLDLLAEIMGEAPRLAEHLSNRPSVLESVLSADFHAAIPDANVLLADCQRHLDDAPAFEQKLDASRRWNSDRRFQIGVQLLQGPLAPARAAEHLSDVADAVLRTLYPVVLDEFALRHGRVAGAEFAVLALGKLGSRELMPTSDLDLVFLYRLPASADASDGAKPLPASQYFGRLCQRLIAAVTAMTAEGMLYEIDMRLRPTGNKGPIATPFDGFVTYQNESAWTWEHMALTRARIVVADAEFGTDAEAAIGNILRRRRNREKTATEVAEMRGRIEKQHRSQCPFALKHVPGGQLDIDFIGQFLVLTHAASTPGLAGAAANQVFEVAAAGEHLSSDDAAALIGARAMFQAVQTFLSLTVGSDVNEQRVQDFSAALKEDLLRIADAPSFEILQQRLIETEREIRRIFVDLVGDPSGP
ncbi:MAG: bifunctional [glutamine synthetase] adenylyltransferase/[glutamine synthetase]-adenylyl-L-tyrosine phosphorylase [Proteobacteria bacterium]|nr:bifunctional [glutamine synthetase] adenylyltransferase/[glutamine synthetase]-adenylyl-L-tyrosine phosphorylase [Pseudomonadota bacterium]